jgi:division protein CdvB (Snf7/Vps24/ESCRT-III family)
MSDDQSDKILRRLESVEKTLNLIYKDRDVMEQTHVRVGTLTDEVKVLQDRVAKLEKRLVADIQDVKTEIQEKGDE